MKRAPRSPFNNWLAALLVGLLVAGLGLGWLIYPIGQALSRRSHDLLQRWHPAPPSPSEIIIVSMDDRSFVELRQDPTRYWDRSLHARMLRRLTEEGASVVVFDVLFNAPATDPQTDQDLAEAMRRHGHVVIPAKVENDPGGGQANLRQPLLPAEPLLQQATWGSVEYTPDSDGVVRRIRDGTDFICLARRAAEAFTNSALPHLNLAWLRYYGRPGAIRTVSYHEALTPASLPPGWCRGKIVFIGHGKLLPPKHVSIPDEFPTPFGAMSGVEIQATTCGNLLHQQAWREASPTTEILVVLLLGLGLGLLTRLRDPRMTVLLQFGIVIILLAGVWLQVTHQQRWFPWLIPLLIQLPLGVVLTSFSHFFLLRRENLHLATEKRLLERRLESYPEHTPAEARLHTLSGASSEQVAALIPDYNLIKVIGSGAYGEVWLARSIVGSHVAIKIMFRDRFDDAEPYEREFRGIKKFMSAVGSHPGWVHILHVGRIDQLSCFYYVMELADDASTTNPGPLDPETYAPKSLRTVLDQRGPYSPDECIELGIGLAEALGHLHQQGLIHRDIKPANVILVRGLPRFADVGLITAIAKPGEELTQVGTLGYLAPEGPGTAVADLYGLGKLLYVCATGKSVRNFPEPPTALFGGEGMEKLMGLNDVILRACELEPEQRFKNAEAMQRALEELRNLTEG